jgi:hypothetical protein
MSKEVR